MTIIGREEVKAKSGQKEGPDANLVLDEEHNTSKQSDEGAVGGAEGGMGAWQL